MTADANKKQCEGKKQERPEERLLVAIGSDGLGSGVEVKHDTVTQ
jgi:hypothetical protein